MSLLGAMNTAISGLTAQSNAFNNISDNVANSQTIGFKRIDTAFVDFLTVSTADINVPGSVVARPDYANNVQGSLTQTENPLSMAIAGSGFFSVSQKSGETSGLPSFAGLAQYTRAWRSTQGQEISSSIGMVIWSTVPASISMAGCKTRQPES